jgi:hypothetical protein
MSSKDRTSTREADRGQGEEGDARVILAMAAAGADKTFDKNDIARITHGDDGATAAATKDAKRRMRRLQHAGWPIKDVDGRSPDARILTPEEAGERAATSSRPRLWQFHPTPELLEILESMDDELLTERFVLGVVAALQAPIPVFGDLAREALTTILRSSRPKVTAAAKAACERQLRAQAIEAAKAQLRGRPHLPPGFMGFLRGA